MALSGPEPLHHLDDRRSIDTRSNELRDIAVYSLLVLFLVLRPGGLFGERHLVPREI